MTINMKAIEQKNEIGCLRGSAYALFNYLKRVDDSMILGETEMSDLTKENVLFEIEQLMKKLHANLEELKDTLS
jgi:hypothetical protein